MTTPLFVRLLGSVQVRLAEQPIEHFRTKKVQALLLLLVAGEKRPSRAQLMTMLWPDNDEATAKRNLRQALYHLRRNLSAADAGVPLFVSTRDYLQLHPDAPIECDLHQFRAALHTVANHPHDDLLHCTSCYQTLETAVSLVRGSFLADFFLADSNLYEEWAAGIRQEIAQSVQEALETLSAAAFAQGDLAAAEQYARRQIQLDPLRERGYQQLITVQAHGGRRDEALATYAQLEATLKNEMGVSPSQAISALATAVRTGELGENQPFLPLVSRNGAENPYLGLLPFTAAEANYYFGREEAVQRLQTAVQNQLFTAVIGPSGSGKSSLVQAGLLPVLEQAEPAWQIGFMRPDSQPDQTLSATRQTLRGSTSPRLLIVDQFEALYTQTTTPTVRDRFINQLLDAMNDDGIHVLLTLRADFFDRPLQHPKLGQLMQNGTFTLLPLNTQETARAITGPAAAVGVTVAPDLVAALTTDLNDQPNALPLLQFTLTELFTRRDGSQLTFATYRELGGIGGAISERAEGLFSELDDVGQQWVQQLFLQLITFFGQDKLTGHRLPDVEWPPAPPQVNSDAIVDQFVTYRLLARAFDQSEQRPVLSLAHESLMTSWPRLAAWISGAQIDLEQRRGLRSLLDAWLAASKEPGYLLRGAQLETYHLWSQRCLLPLTVEEQAFLQASQQQEAARRAARQALERRSQRFLQGLVALLLFLVVGSLIVTAVISNQRRDLQREQERTAQSLATAVSAEATSEADARAAQLALAQSRISQAAQALAAQDTSSALLLALEANKVPDPSIQVEEVLAAAAFAPGARQIWHTSWLFPAQEAAIQALAILPDGHLLLGDGDGRLRRWEPGTETTIWSAAKHDGPIHELLAIDNGARAVTAGDDGQVIVWDTQDGTPLAVFQHPGPVLALAKQPIGPWLAAGGAGRGGATATGVVRLWDLNNGDLLAETSEAPRNQVIALAFSPDGNHLLLSSGRRSYAAVDEFDLISLTLPDLAVDGSWQTAAHDNRELHFAGIDVFYTTSSDQRVYRWAIDAAEPTAVWDNHRDQVVALDVTRDGRFLLTGTDSGDLFVWDAHSGQPTARLLLHDAVITALAIAPNDRQAYSADAAGGLILWDLRPFGRTLTLTEHDAPVLDVAFMPDGASLVSSSGRMTGSSPMEDDNRLLLWNVRTGRLERVFVGHQDSIFQFVLTPDGEKVVSTSFDQTIRIWNTATAAQEGVIFTGAVQLAVAIGPRGERLATSQLDGGITIWDLATETAVHNLSAQSPQIWALDISPDGRYLLSGGDDGVSLWDMASGNFLQRWTEHTETVTAVRFSPDGNRAITAGNDNSLLLWDVATGEILQRFDGHFGIRTRVTFSADGQYLISSGWDGEIIVRDLATGIIKQQLQGHETTFIMDLALSPDGQQLATAGVDNQIILWQLTAGFEDLTEWIRQNRALGMLACDARPPFRLQPCED